MASAILIAAAAAANVARKPTATTSACALVTLLVPEALANATPSTEAPVVVLLVPRQRRDRPTTPEGNSRCRGGLRQR